MQNISIKNGNIFRPDCRFHTGNLSIAGGVISEVESSDSHVIDAEGLYIIPGLTDIHFHGCAGYDFCDGTPEALKNSSRMPSALQKRPIM